ncbi:2,3-diketo-L-gulonate TRAP transporter small permease protein YiaM [compost metagenome]
MSPAQNGLVDRMIAVVCQAILWLTTTVIFLILSANTLLRYSTGSSLQWANEVPELLFPWLVMSGVVLAAQHGSHIATTFLMESLPSAAQRWLSAAGWLVVAALYGTLAKVTYSLLEIVHDEKSAILHVPSSVTYSCVMGAMGLLALLAMRSAFRSAWYGPQAFASAAPGASPSTAQG